MDYCSNSLGLHVSSTCLTYCMHSLCCNLTVRGWLASQADISKNVQNGTGSSYSPLTRANIEYSSSQMSIPQSSVALSENCLPRSALAKPSGRPSFSGPQSVSMPQCKSAALPRGGFPPTNQNPAQEQTYAAQSSKDYSSLSEQERRQSALHTHVCTHMNGENFHEKPYMVYNLWFQ